MSPFGLKFSQMILHTETSKLMYNNPFSLKFCTSHSYPVPLNSKKKKNNENENVNLELKF